MDEPTLTPTELEKLPRRGEAGELIEVRTPTEYRELRAESARLVLLDVLDPKAVMDSRNGSKDHPLDSICRSGSRGRTATEKFHVAGFTNILNVEGGSIAWVQAGLAVVRGKKAMSFERQVRIAAESLVVLGMALGTFIHPAFLGLSAFVGAGLVFAGLTDTCGMGMALCGMPWNGRGEAIMRHTPEETRS